MAVGIITTMITVISKRITPTGTAFPTAAVEEDSEEVTWAVAMPGVAAMVVEVMGAVVAAAIGRGRRNGAETSWLCACVDRSGPGSHGKYYRIIGIENSMIPSSKGVLMFKGSPRIAAISHENRANFGFADGGGQCGLAVRLCSSDILSLWRQLRGRGLFRCRICGRILR